MHLRKGTLLKHGDYRIESVLGQGGFGITYLAVQTGLNRKVTIKEFFMSDFCERDPETSHVSLGTSGSRETVERFKAKFIKEAQTIAVLNNPHIIRIHDVFEENGTAYYVMEYHGGGTLAGLVKDGGGLPERQAVHYIRQIADALQYIHNRNMNHLDVKPGNVLLDEKGNAVLIDFGLAKRYDVEGNQTSTTPVGISHGYAPLEQYQQGGVSVFSPATDIYSLGATLYKLITGNTPPNATVVGEDGLPAFPSDVSSSVVSAIERAMHFRRKDRPQSIAEFLALLDAPTSEKVVPVSKFDESTVFPEDEGKGDKTDNNVNTPKVADNKPVIAEPERKKSKSWLWILIAMLGVGVGLSALFMGGGNSPVPIVEEEGVPPTENIAVDLGLPSGTLWADRNVGADSPEDYGDYFAWGETEPKSTYDWSSYKWCNGNDRELTKYCTKSSYGYNGFTDDKATLEMSDDAAYINMGSKWRMPTGSEFEELIDNCTWTWTTRDSVNGYKVVGTNGNSIFFPAAGYYFNRELCDVCTDGYYWSGSLCEYFQNRGSCLEFDSDNFNHHRLYRGIGCAVRAVVR